MYGYSYVINDFVVVIFFDLMMLNFGLGFCCFGFWMWFLGVVWGLVRWDGYGWKWLKI